MNALVYVDLDQGIHKKKHKNALHDMGLLYIKYGKYWIHSFKQELR